MAGLIIPNIFPGVISAPLIFLAGPVRGAPNWQDDAAEYILSNNSKFTVISPRRDIREKISEYAFNGDNNYFSRQREWELYHFDINRKKGCVMFWLPGETEHNCDKSYGAMTREELGLIMAHYFHDKSTRFCIGTDGKFSEIDTLRYDLSRYAPDKRIFSTLEETCDEAIRIALS
ncbi:hypothetical protein HYT25_00010 [Candidatus Pacearchaeota archaeon]|nr:hypothetical protein [Candidatus Pacearchaeota archaeon]